VLAHHRPDQVVRLAQRILTLSPTARVIVHWDGRSPQPFPEHLLPPRAGVLPARIPAWWGTWSLVEATLALLEEALRAGASWAVLISGEDWPATDLARWESELVHASFDALLSARPVRDRWSEGERRVPVAEDEVRRYEGRWHVHPPAASPRIERLRRGVTRRLERWCTFRHGPAVMDFYTRGVATTWRRGRGLPDGWTAYKGHQWMTVNARAARALLEAPAPVTEHYRHTLIPDEGFAPTVLHNAADVTVQEGLTSYAPWSRFGRVPSMVLHAEDLPDVESSRAPFARKIGQGEHEQLMGRLDRLVSRGRVRD
jgi:hypothetical protein